MRLRDTDATFVAVAEDGSIKRLPDATGAHALWFECPCGGRHHNLIAFEPTIDTEPTTRCGGRWQRTGTTLDNISLAPSIAVKSGDGSKCWHGWITNGEIK